MNLPHPAPGMEYHPGITRPGIGAFMRARYVVPQNPILDGSRPLRARGAGPASVTDGVGLGWTMPDITSYVPQSVYTGWQQVAGGLQSGLSNPWVVGGLVLAGVVLLGVFRPGRSAYKSELADARAKYRERVAGIRRKYPSVGRRALRAASAAGEAW